MKKIYLFKLSLVLFFLLSCKNEMNEIIEQDDPLNSGSLFQKNYPYVEKYHGTEKINVQITPWGEYLKEGDISIPSEELTDEPNYKKGALSNDAHAPWPRFIPYVNAMSGGSNTENELKAALREIEEHTTVQFIHRTWQPTYIKFVDSPGNSSDIGMNTNQGENLVKIHNKLQKTIVHETLHRIGFGHEHNRPDRDKYLNIYWNNMSNPAGTQYQKHTTSNYETDYGPFDYNSILIYDSWDSGNGKIVMTRKSDGSTFKHSDKMTFQDKQDVIRKYPAKELGPFYFVCQGTTPRKLQHDWNWTAPKTTTVSANGDGVKWYVERHTKYHNLIKNKKTGQYLKATNNNTAVKLVWGKSNASHWTMDRLDDGDKNNDNDIFYIRLKGTNLNLRKTGETSTVLDLSTNTGEWTKWKMWWP